jgi:putative endonuclease
MTDSQHNRKLARLGENAAAEELERRGYRILDRNYLCRWGEADIVAEDGDDLVFAEVKTRAELRHGLPQDSVGWTKQRRVGRAALHFCREYGLEDRPLRFDVVEVVVLRGQIATVEVIPDAFVPDL